MKKSIGVWITMLSASGAVKAAEPRGNQSPVLPPIVTRPLPGAVEERPIWDRPTGDSMTLQRGAEAAMDRGTRRVEESSTFELKQIDRQRGDDALRTTTSATDTAERALRDREEQVEQLRLTSQREATRQRVLEREEDVLAKERSAWRAALVAENAGTSAAAVDREAFARIENEYRAALNAATQRRDALVAAAGNNREQRAAAEREYQTARAAAEAVRAERRKVVLGGK